MTPKPTEGDEESADVSANGPLTIMIEDKASPLLEDIPTLYIGVPKGNFTESICEADFRIVRSKCGEDNVDGYICKNPTEARLCINQFLSSVDTHGHAPIPRTVRIIISSHGDSDDILIKNIRMGALIKFQLNDDVLVFQNGGNLSFYEIFRLLDLTSNALLHLELIICNKNAYKWKSFCIQHNQHNSRKITFLHDVKDSYERTFNERGTLAIQKWTFLAPTEELQIDTTENGETDEALWQQQLSPKSPKSPKTWSSVGPKRGYAPVKMGTAYAAESLGTNSYRRMYQHRLSGASFLETQMITVNVPDSPTGLVHPKRYGARYEQVGPPSPHSLLAKAPGVLHDYHDLNRPGGMWEPHLMGAAGAPTPINTPMSPTGRTAGGEDGGENGPRTSESSDHSPAPWRKARHQHQVVDPLTNPKFAMKVVSPPRAIEGEMSTRSRQRPGLLKNIVISGQLGSSPP